MWKTSNGEKTPSALCLSFDQLLPTAPMFTRLKYTGCNQQMFVSPNCSFLCYLFLQYLNRIEGTGSRFAVCHLILQLWFPADDLPLVKARQWREKLKGDLAYSLSPCLLHRFPQFFKLSGCLCLPSDCVWPVGRRLFCCKWPWKFNLHLLMKISHLLVSPR